MADKKKGWPHSEEEHDSHVRGYEQDVLAGQRRLQELEETGNGDTPAADQARDQIENAKRELRRLGVGQAAAEKRPARGAKETR